MNWKHLRYKKKTKHTNRDLFENILHTHVRYDMVLYGILDRKEQHQTMDMVDLSYENRSIDQQCLVQ